MTSFPTRTIGQPVQANPLGDEARRREQEREMLQRYGRAGYLIDEAVTSEWALPWAMRQFERASQPIDPEFRLTEELVNHYGEGVDPELWEMFSGANSIDGMEMIREQALEVSEARGRLRAAGTTGLLTQVGVGILDPAFIAAAVGITALTGGTGTVAAGATKGARVGALLRAGLIGGVSDATVQSYISSQDPQQGGREVVYAGLGAFALGSAVGGAGEAWRGLRSARARRLMRDIEFEDALGVQAMGAASPIGIERGTPLTPETRRRLAELVATDDQSRAYFKQNVTKEEQDALWGRVINESGLADDDELVAELAALDPADAFYRFQVAQQAFFDRVSPKTPVTDLPDDVGADATGGGPPRDFQAGDFDGSWAAALPETPRADQVGRNPFTYHAILGRLEDDEARRLGYLLANDPVLRDPNLPQGDTALEFKRRQVSRQNLQLFKSEDGYDQAFADFRRAREIPITQSHEASKSFGRKTTQAILQGGHADPIIQKSRKAVARTFAEMGEMAQRHGVRGFEEFVPDDNYFPFMHSPEKIRAAESIHGEDGVFRLIRESMEPLAHTGEKRGPAVRAFMQAEDITSSELARVLDMEPKDLARILASDEGPDDALLERIAGIVAADSDDIVTRGQELRLDVLARGYHRIIRDLDRVPQSQSARALMGDDPEGLAELLRIGGIEDEALIESVTKNALAEKASGAESPLARGKRSVPLKRDTFIQTDGGDLSWGDLIEDDAAYVASRYIDDIAGAIGETEILRTMSRTMRDADTPDFTSYSQLRRALERRLLRSFPTGQKAKTDDVLKRFDEMFDHLRGRPLTADNAWNRTFRRLRMFSSSVYNGSFGLVNLTELSQPMAEGGVRAVFRQAPATLHYAKLARKRQLPREFWSFADSFSDGFEADISRFRTRFETGGAIEELGGTVTDRRLFDLARVSNIANGLIPIDRRLRVNAMRVAEDGWIQSARSGKLPSKKRLQSLGMTEADARGIIDQLNAPGGMAKTTDTFGRTVHKADFAKWADQRAAGQLILALQRWSGRVIQNQSLGDMAPWMANSEFFKMMMQFRVFPWAAWDKQLVTKLQFRDTRAAVAAGYGLAASTLVYIGRTHIAGAGREDRQEFLEESLSPQRIAAGAIRYAGWTSFLPDITDTFLPPGERFFDSRYSGLSSSLLSVDRAPVPSMVAKAAQLPAEILDSILAGQVSREDLDAFAGLMPLSTHVPVAKLTDAIGTLLPEEDDE